MNTPPTNIDHATGRAADPAPPVSDDADRRPPGDAALPAADLPAADLLRVLAEEVGDRRTRESLRRRADRLDAGESPAAVFDPAADGGGRRGAALPDELHALLASGVPDAALGDVLARLSAVERHRADRRREWLAVFAYPAVLFAAAVVFIGVSSTLFLPGFRRIFDDFGTQLPPLTQLVLGVGEVLTLGRLFTPGGLVVAGVVLCFPVLPLVVHLVLRARGGVGLSRFLPSAGGAGELASFCHLLAMLLAHGIPLPRALGAVSAAVRDPRLAFDTLELSAAVGNGVPLFDAAYGRRRFPPAVRHAFRWEDDPPAFAAALSEVAELQERRASVSAAAWVALVEPAFVVVLGLGVGLVCVALYLPLIQLLNDLS